MYTVTFYSFKGGVGRSMALVNAGVQLAKKGKKVLLVDFDLEAPGLTTFALKRPQDPVPGIVDYVHEYLQTGIAPPATRYCYQSEQFEGGGQIWIMPSGIADHAYSSHFNSINWLDLYENKDGYLLFEDLKLQWATAVGADYALIDSRTGHSDVEGICTRQLPDAVCFLFFPNEQNLDGLTRVASLVRRESITTHFVASNTPDLDDEDGILRNTLGRFKTALKYKSLAAEIHHYPSLTLLNQDVFSLTRPNSRLTKEYKRLVEALVSENLQDKDAALGRLRRMRRDFPEEGAAVVPQSNKLTHTIEKVLRYFPSDPEVRLQSALSYESLGETQDALDLLTKETIEKSSAPATGYAARARLLSRRGVQDETVEALKAMLDSTGSDLPTLLDAASLISAHAPQLFERFGASNAVRSLPRDDRFFVATQCEGDVSQLRTQVDILMGLIEDAEHHQQEDQVSPASLRRQAAIAYIGLGEFEKAISQFEQAGSTEFSDIVDVFNLAMARWGAHGVEDAIPLMQQVVDLHNNGGYAQSPNYFQCLALANLVVDQIDEGRKFLTLSRNQMKLRPHREFSCWSYVRVDSETFLSHLDDIERFAGDKSVTPEFISRQRRDLFE
jgi:MinD-like ATPase involved in chromosome partitioning or flagellar assembly